jgi:hypothetical protein
MKVVITRANKEGSFDLVSESYRCVLTVNDEHLAHLHAMQFAKGDPYRLEFFYGGTLMFEPDKTTYRYGKYARYEP